MSYIFEDAPGTGGYAPVSADQLKGALANSGLDQSTQQSIFNTILPPAPSRTSSGGNGGGGMPSLDWGSLINNDPFLRQAQADSAAQSAEDAVNRKVAIDKALAQWGQVPDFASEAGSLGLNPSTLGFLTSDVDQATKDLADKNTKEGLSIFSRLQKQNSDNIRSIKRALAARGMAASGETGHQLGDEALRYKQDLTDNEQKLLDYITGVVSAFTQGERGRLRDLAQQKMDATDRAIGLYGTTMGDGSGGGSGSGGSGGSGGGGIQWQPDGGLSQSNIAAAGFNPSDVVNTIHATMAQRGWGNYVVNGGVNAPMVHDNGQVHEDGGGKFIYVKVGYPSGAPSTEKIYLSGPSAVVQTGGGGGSSSSSSGGGGGSAAPSGGGNTVSSGGVQYSNPFGLSIS